MQRKKIPAIRDPILPVDRMAVTYTKNPKEIPRLPTALSRVYPKNRPTSDSTPPRAKVLAHR